MKRFTIGAGIVGAVLAGAPKEAAGQEKNVSNKDKNITGVTVEKGINKITNTTDFYKTGSEDVSLKRQSPKDSVYSREDYNEWKNILGDGNEYDNTKKLRALSEIKNNFVQCLRDSLFKEKLLKTIYGNEIIDEVKKKNIDDLHNDILKKAEGFYVLCADMDNTKVDMRAGSISVKPSELPEILAEVIASFFVDSKLISVEEVTSLMLQVQQK